MNDELGMVNGQLSMVNGEWSTIAYLATFKLNHHYMITLQN